jgi:exodeoxyribonuclease VII large subunit
VSQGAFDLDDLDAGLDDGGLPTFTVGELADAINGTLRRSFTEGVWVRGEIQGWNERNGHAYFQLVETTPEGRRATLSVSFFANNRVRLRPMLQKSRLRLADGLKVRIHGYLDFYAPNGRLSLKMGGIDPRYTLGEMSLQRDEVVRRLVAAGLFDRNRALPFPAVPLRVGVVTSVGSAAWHDFSHELDRSGLGFRLRVIDVNVQGEWAAEMVSRAISTLEVHDDLDVVVVIRGGGSRTDLSAFDTDVVARAIANSRLPVLTGLGHEIDRSVADEVAHLSLKTPTATAGALIERVAAAVERTEASWRAIATHAARHVARSDRALGSIAQRVRTQTQRATDRAEARLDGVAGRVPVAALRTLDAQRARIEGAAQRVPAEARRHLVLADRDIASVAARITALDPAHALARGWTITHDGSGRLVRSPTDVAPGDELVTRTAGGDIRSRVESGGRREDER